MLSLTKGKDMKKLTVNLKERSYDITIGENILDRANEFFNLNRKVVILTDDGVPSSYAKSIASKCKDYKIITLPQGEPTKNIDTYVSVLKEMLSFNLTRTDAIVGVGGGVIGDLTGFCASTYMRGIDFYNVPTTLLSMVDSSIGGKTGVDFGGVKNSVGTFYQPKGVLVDVKTLNTLSDRQFNNGLAESIKMATTFDKELFSLIESGDVKEDILTIVEKSLLIKKAVVEQDEKEKGLRKVLNFGHTLAHAIEGVSNMQDYYHGEAVAIGMVKMASGIVNERLIPLLKKCNLPVAFTGDKEKMAEFISHDKKCSGEFIDVVKSDKIGSYKIEKISIQDLVSKIL